MKIYINNQLIETDEKTIKLVSNSPIFNEKSGDCSYDISVPATDINKKVLGYPHRISRDKNNLPEYSLRIELGTMQKHGVALVNKAGSRYDISCGFDRSDFSNMIGKKTLRDITYGDPILFTQASEYKNKQEHFFERHFTAVINSNPQIHKLDGILPVYPRGVNLETDFFRIIGKGYTSGNHLGFADIIFKQAGTFKVLINYHFDFNKGNDSLSSIIIKLNGALIHRLMISPGGNQVRSFEKVLTVKEGDYLRSELDIVLEWSKSGLFRKYSGEIRFYSSDPPGYATRIHVEPSNSESLKDYALKRYPEVNFCLAPVLNVELMQDISDETIGTDYATCPIVNLWDPNAEEFPNTINIEDKVIPNIFSPMPYVAYILDRIAHTFGYTLRRNIFSQGELSTLVLHNTFIQNEYDQTDPNKLFSRGRSWNLADSMPKMPIEDFLSIIQLFGARMYIDNATKTMDIVYIKDILTGSVADEIIIHAQQQPTILYNEVFGGFSLSMKNDDGFSGEQEVDLSNFNFVGSFPPNDEPEEPQINDCYFSEGDYAYRAYSLDNETKTVSWKKIGLHTASKKTEEDSEKIFSVESKIGVLLSRRPAEYIEDPGPFFSIPILAPYMNNVMAIAQNPGKIKNALETIDSDIIGSLSFYRGIVGRYPLLNGDLFGPLYHERIEGANIALRWDGSNGLYETYWKPVLDWIIEHAKPIEINVKYMSTSDFKKLNFSQKQDLSDHILLIDRVDADASEKGMSNVKIKGYLV